MDWLSSENVIAVVTAVVGVLATIGALWYERRVPRRKRIGYRVQMDTPIGDNVRTGEENARLGLFHETPGMSDATLVLVRIENDGAQSIAGSDYSSPDGRHHGLTATFTGRTVRGLAVTQPSDAEHLREHLTPPAGLRYEGGVLHIPKVPLNRGEHFKLLVLLTGGPVGSPVAVSGGIHNGRVESNRSTTPDDKPPLLGRPAQLLAGLLTLCVIALAALVVLRDDTPPPMGCARGALTVVGSTAFQPVAAELARKYQDDCEGSTIEVRAHGSASGVRELLDAGTASGHGSPAMVALSDGPRGGRPELNENRLAVSVFALVVRDDVRLRNLAVDDVRRLYRGRIANWSELGGPDLPVVLVSRGSNSGTRETFRRRVLGGAFEPRASSSDCSQRDDPDARVVRCELDSTDQVLETVARTPGAIGYSELRDTEHLKGLHRLDLDGHTPGLAHIEPGGYPYHEIEYAYTYGMPPADSLASSFLAYAMRGPGQDVVRTHGHLPCAAPDGLRVCAEP